MCNLHALRHKASADDGKRRTAVLEVDVSPLRANRGESLRGGSTGARPRGNHVNALGPESPCRFL